MKEDNWFRLDDPGGTDSPALLVYPRRIDHNIREMIRIAGNAERLVPHIKTHKMSAVVRMQLAAGIRRFKCATIAEAEMLASSGAGQVVLAYQLNEAKARRFVELVRHFGQVRFASVVDNTNSARLLDRLFGAEGLSAEVFIDIDNGMHRTGFPSTGDMAGFYRELSRYPHLRVRGFHVYDGHIRDKDFEERKARCMAAFQPIADAVSDLRASGDEHPEVIAGGSPTFPVHALNPGVSLSPGTSLLWDQGYSELLTEQPFLQAAVLLTRIISRNTPGQITTDLGHKSVAAENPVTRRIALLNLSDYRILSQSEEHLVIGLREQDREARSVGDVLYAIPYHICPSVALYDEAQVVEDGKVTGQWMVEARRKKITF